MTTNTIRVEIHPPGTTPEHRSPLPLASATLTINGTTPTDPNALPTVASIVSGGFSGACLAFITPLGVLAQSGGIWCSVGKVPDTTAEPRHLLGATTPDAFAPSSSTSAPTIGSRLRVRREHVEEHSHAKEHDRPKA